MPQTSIEWLVQKLEESGIPLMKDELEMIEQAKEMNRGEIEHSFIFGKYSIISFEDYYKERFKKD
jgi:hypothetical protein